MDLPFHTPFLDTLKQGQADRDIRMMVAEGSLGLRREELRAALEFLAQDPDPEVARTAAATLERKVADAAPEEAEASEADSAAPSGDPEERKLSTLQKIGTLNPAQRLALAMKGNREERAILIRDPNKIVAAAVLSSPKISESEIASIAKMANISEDVLRIIGNTRAWMKSYVVATSLVRNPKTPLAISMNLLVRLHEKDLKQVSTDRNIPDALRTAARKKLAGAAI